MRVMPIRYVTDPQASLHFYQALGLELGAASRPGEWLELPAAGGVLALHAAEPGDAQRCELAFEATEPLEAIADRLRGVGHDDVVLLDESFGRSLQVRDPDGVLVQVNENDRSLYT